MAVLNQNNDLRLYADVVLPYKLKELTYEVPFGLEGKIFIGQMVSVALGKNKILSGVVARVHSEVPDFKVKPIESILDEFPALTQTQIDFWRWMADYYLCTIGEVMNAALPAYLKIEQQSKVYASDFSDSDNLDVLQETILRYVQLNKMVTIADLSKKIKNKNLYTSIQLLLSKKLLYLYEEEAKTFKALEIRKIMLGEDFKFELGLEQFMMLREKRYSKQLELLKGIFDMLGNNKACIQKPELISKEFYSASSYNSLINKGIIVEKRETTARYEQNFSETKPLKELNSAQQKAYESIKQSLSLPKTVLLHGVTSSGKTEVYLHLIKEALERNEQVLYLLPEIGLTSQIISRINKNFGAFAAVYHSGLNSAEKYEIWRALLNPRTSKLRLIVGVRSAIFLPFSNLTLIIVDEEHEPSYKQADPAPRYNARDMAIVLAQMYKSGVILGSATPSIESYFNAKIAKYDLVEITERFDSRKMPHIELVDMKLKQNQLKNSVFSPVLLKNIQQALDKQEQVILFRNRRGFAPILVCNDCGTIPKCKNCDVSLTYHKESNSLVCHYCGYSIANTGKCASCKSSNLNTVGFGTQKLEEDIQYSFANARIARVDTDSMSAKNAYNKLFSAFENGQIDILVGTQILAKGLDFKNVNTIGVLSVDSLTNMPDFRANERAFQLLTQVSGRAGRHQGEGKVLMQVLNTSNKMLSFVKTADYFRFFENEIVERKEFKYPPFVKLIKIDLRHQQENLVEKAAQVLVSLLGENKQLIVLGPIYPYVKKYQNKYNLQLLVKLARSKELVQEKLFVKTVVENLYNIPEFKQVQCFLDVDPY